MLKSSVKDYGDSVKEKEILPLIQTKNILILVLSHSIL